MVSCRLRHLALSLLAAASLLTSGCLTTIDSACTSIAQTHCASCFSCAGKVDGVTGAELCNVPASAGTSQSACEDALAGVCERQGRSMQDPFGDLNQCQTAVDNQTCDDLVSRQALDQSAAPSACERFL